MKKEEERSIRKRLFAILEAQSGYRAVDISNQFRDVPLRELLFGIEGAARSRSEVISKLLRNYQQLQMRCDRLSQMPLDLYNGDTK